MRMRRQRAENETMNIVEPHTRTLHTRRQFLRTSMLGAAAAWSLPIFLEKTFLALDAMAADSPIQTINGKDGPILVVLQLAGGNDGLNTLVPYADDAYHRARRVLGIKADAILKLNDYAGLHPKLTGLKSIYDEGHLAVVQGVGYPNPNRSHFRSTEIWQTASDSEENRPYGWLGNYFDACCKGADPTIGVSIGNAVPQAFASKTPTGISFARPEQYRWVSGDKESADSVFRELNQPGDEASSGSSIEMIGGAAAPGIDPLDFLQRTALDAQLSSDKVLEISRKYRSSVEYPRGPLADSFNLVARMIAGGLATRIYYVSQGGYDTHTGQLNTHDRLMGDLNEALAAFFKDLKAQGNFDRVLLMTFSEFGRRVEENASGGTDHGAAAPLFVAGGKVKAGLFGKYPSLTQLDNGDLIHNVDFRSVYASVLQNWLHAPPKLVLGRNYPTLPIV